MFSAKKRELTEKIIRYTNIFNRWDKDGDKLINRDEFNKAF